MSRARLIASSLLALCIALALPAVSTAEGIVRVVQYRSPIDDSLQAYGAYLPSTPPASEAGFPAVLHGHGYGWSVGTRFSEFQTQWADAHGWVLIHLNARGPTFYEGVGDYETLRVVEDACERFGLDRDRIYMTGGSMGGTGALRHGLRHPDVFAAVMGVDGWTDFRLWHKHWYARTDAVEQIEEFRRPLLQASSPLYWAERGELGATGHIVDGSDTTVWPENGFRLYERLRELSLAAPPGYDQRIISNPTLGHGAGTDYEAIYDFFRGRRRVREPRTFTIQTTILPHGELYWARIEDFHVDGMSGTLRVTASDDVVATTTGNLSGFTLFLTASPLAERESVRIYADGFPCYEGPPVTLALSAERDQSGALIGWHAEPAANATCSGLVKRPGLSGPIGDAFLRPFTVVWGSDGPPEEVARHRLEAEQFAKDWNAFFVHGTGIVAQPEGDLHPDDLESHTLVVFGTLDTSSLLRLADSIRPFPVRVLSDGVIVSDQLSGDRRYMGEQFGAMLCVPNPLTDFTTHLIIANRRVFTQPESQVPQLLAYDLEKLPWGYPDYLIFNNDQAQLPFVLNVNNKPPVTCYEAAYFVEADYFDDRWELDRLGELRRVRLQKPEEHRLAHISELALETREGITGASVRVVDSTGEPVPTARVTGRWWGDREVVRSASADEEGRAWFAAPEDALLERQAFEVVSVMATGCTWDWPADTRRKLATSAQSPEQFDLSVLSDRPVVLPGGCVTLKFRACNSGPVERRAQVRPLAPSGRIAPESHEVTVPAEGNRELSFIWWPQDRAAGPAELRASLRALDGDASRQVERPLPVTVLPDAGLPVALMSVKPVDQDYGAPWRVNATLRNLDPERAVETRVHCAIMEAGAYPAAKTALLEPGGEAVVTWEESGPLPKGDHLVRVTVEGARGATLTGRLAVR